MLDTINSLAALTMLGLSAYALGLWLVRGLQLDGDDALANTVWSLGLGMVASGMVLAALGLAGCLYRELLGVLTFCGGFWGLAEIVRAFLRWRAEGGPEKEADGAASRPGASANASPTYWTRDLTAMFAVVACGASLIAALAPPTAGDALCYHLELPKVFLSRHALVDVPYSDNATFPLLIEMWYLWGLALEGGVTAQLIHWGLGVLFALAAVVLATPVLGRPWAWGVGAVVVLIPGVSNQMTAPLNDVGLAAMTALTLVAWRRAAADDSPGRWYAAAGIMLGAALGTKYLGIVFAAAMVATWLGQLAVRGTNRRALLSGAATAAVIAVSVAGVWYARAAWYRGNPVYPFFERQIGGDAGPEGHSDKTPLGWHPFEVLSAPWQVTMHAERFGGGGHQWGPLFLALLPGLFWARRLRGLASLLALAAIYAALWYGLRQNLRFLLPIVPPLAVAAVWVWIELRRLPLLPAALTTAAMLGMLALGAAAPVRRARDKAAVALGIESRAAFLARNEPTYRATQWANLELGPNDRLLSQDQRAFYFAGDVVRENVYRRRTAYDQSIDRPTELGQRLREAGFSHVLLAECDADQGITFDATLCRLVDEQLSAERQIDPRHRTLRLVTEYEFVDADGPRRYRLIGLR